MFNKFSRDDILAHLHFNPTDIIFLSGSIIEGYGNARSDLDIFIFTDETYINPLTNTNVMFKMINNQYVDIEYILQSSIEELISGVNRLDFNDPNAYLMFKYDFTIIELLHRFLNGHPIYNEDKFNELRNKLNKQQLIRYIMRKKINFFDNALNDVLGAYESADYYSALFMAKTILDMANDILLAGYGDTSTKDKWRIRRMQRFFGQDSKEFKKYMSLHFLSLNSEDEMIQYIEEVINYSNDLVEQAQEKVGGM